MGKLAKYGLSIPSAPGYDKTYLTFGTYNAVWTFGNNGVNYN